MTSASSHEIVFFEFQLLQFSIDAANLFPLHFSFSNNLHTFRQLRKFVAFLATPSRLLHILITIFETHFPLWKSVPVDLFRRNS